MFLALIFLLYFSRRAKICICVLCEMNLLRVLDNRSTKSDGEPVDELGDGDKADAEAESANPSHVGDEVQPGHLWSSLEL